MDCKVYFSGVKLSFTKLVRFRTLRKPDAFLVGYILNERIFRDCGLKCVVLEEKKSPGSYAKLASDPTGSTKKIRTVRRLVIVLSENGESGSFSVDYYFDKWKKFHIITKSELIISD